MKTNKIVLTAAIITSLGTTAFAADTTVGTGNGIAYGTATETSTSTSIAIGNTVKSSGSDSIGIGYDVTVNGFNSIAIGSSRNKPGVENNPQKTIVTGGDENIGIGHKVWISDGYESVAIGSNVRVYSSDVYNYPSYSTVIGSSASSTGYNGTAYGRFATVKERYATALGPWTKANGEYSTAIAYAAKANAENSIALGNSAEANGRGSTAIGQYTEANGEDSLTIGSNSRANSNNSVAIGANAKANGENNIALGYNSSSADVVKTSNALINGHNYKFAGNDPIGTLSIGGNIEEFVLDANGEPILNEDHTDYLKTTKEVHRTITNVAAGRISEESTDAVNGSQLHAVIKAVNEVAANDKDTITTVVAGTNTTVTNDGNHNYTVSVNKDLNNMNSVNLNDASGTKRARLDADKAHFFNDSTSTNTAVTANGVAIENTDNLDQANYGINGMTASGPNHTVRFTTDGITAGNQIINGVKAGVAGTDAVNVDQLNAAVSNATAKATTVVAGKNVTVTEGTNANGGKEYNVAVNEHLTGMKSASFHSNGVMPGSGGDTHISGAGIHLNDLDDINSANISPSVISVRRQGDSQSDLKSDELRIENYNNGNASLLLNTDGLYVGNGTPGTAVQFTTKGISAGGQIINNVKAGVADTDAVNVGQLNNAVSNISNHYDALSNKVNKNHNETKRGIAGTAALAALHPLDFDPDHKLDVMAGVGHFHGSNAVAFGAAYRPNEDLMFTVGSTVGNGDTVLNAGVSYKVGANSGVSRSKVSVSKDVMDMKREMAEIKAQNAKITAILNTVLGVGLPEDQNAMFPDVPQNHWAFEAVDDLAKRGLIIGYEDGLFKGDRALTRYEFAEVVHRAIQRAKELNVPIDGRLVDEFKPELLRFEIEKNGSLERVHTLKSNKDIKRDSYGTIVK